MTDTQVARIACTVTALESMDAGAFAHVVTVTYSLADMQMLIRVSPGEADGAFCVMPHAVIPGQIVQMEVNPDEVYCLIDQTGQTPFFTFRFVDVNGVERFMPLSSLGFGN